MMVTFLYFATCSGQLGSRKHFGKIAFSFQKCSFNGTIIYSGGGGGSVFPLELEAYYQFGSCDQENE